MLDDALPCLAPDRRRLLLSRSGQITVVEDHERLVFLPGIEQLSEVQVDSAPSVLDKHLFPLVGTDENSDHRSRMIKLDSLRADLSYGSQMPQGVEEKLPLPGPAGQHRPILIALQMARRMTEQAFDVLRIGDLDLTCHGWGVRPRFAVAAQFAPLRIEREPHRPAARINRVRSRVRRRRELHHELRSILAVDDLYGFHPDVSTEAVIAVDSVLTFTVRILGIDFLGKRVRQDREQFLGVPLVFHVFAPRASSRPGSPR